jgi:16S rRNA (guanine527-N7)-methyltransferase
MTEEEARAVLILEYGVPRETMARLESFVALLKHESGHQNLIARGTFDTIWTRHILDSAQLVRFGASARTWLDVGSGAGFPGLIVAAISKARVTLVESRRLRVDFLLKAAAVLGLSDRVQVAFLPIERLNREVVDVISARALAPLDRLLPLCHRFADAKTRWILPKGRSLHSELEAIRSTWQGEFHVEPSRTDPQAGIVVATNVRHS